MGESKLSLANTQPLGEMQQRTRALDRRVPTPPPPPPPPAGASVRPAPRRSPGAAHGSGRAFDYLPSIDGLRAIAIAAVVLYHADVAWMPGGFIGVEVFLVISGFLITSLLGREFQRYGSVDITDFWARRARRLLPAMWAVIFCATLYTAYVLPEELATLRGDAIAALGYAANWVLIFDHKSYFEQAGRPSLLKHFWSLAIEQQFYLLWPALFSAFLARIPRAIAILLLVAAAAGSALWMAALFNPDVDPSRLYFGTDTRASGLLLGAALALVLANRPRHAPPTAASGVLEGLSVVALGGLIALCFALDEFDPPLYLGGFFGIAVLTSIVIAAAIAPDSPFVGHVLRAAPLRWLGMRSYSLYLWHFPVFMVSRPQLDLPLDGWPSLLVRIAIAMGCAELSYRFIEQPVRDGALTRLWEYLTQDHGMLRWLLVGAWTLSIAALCIEVAGARAPLPDPASDEVWIAKPKPEAPPEVEVAAAARTARPVAPPEPPPPAAAPPKRLTARQQRAEATAAQTRALSQPLAASAKLTSVAAAATAGVRAPKVLAIGDSVMLGAARHLRVPGADVTIDAVVGRQASAAVERLQQLRAAGQLPDIVFLHIGNNGTLREQQFETIMRLLSSVRTVVFINTKVPRRWQDPNNLVLVEGVRRHRNARLIDWFGHSRNRPEWFRADGYHLHPEGAAAYAALLRQFYVKKAKDQAL